MSLYILVNWLLCLTTSVVLGVLLLRRRFLLIKPGIVVILFFHVMVQWAATIDAGYIEGFLPEPWDFLMLVHVFPLLGLLIASRLFERETRMVWQKIVARNTATHTVHSADQLVLFLAILLITIVYLSYVPLSTTGLFAILFDPENAAISREYSLKLIDNPLLQYMFTFMASAFAPIFASICTLSLIRREQRAAKSLLDLSFLLFTMVIVSLTGARSGSAEFILTVALTWFLFRGTSTSLIYAGVALLLIAIPPTVLTLLREGRVVTLESFWLYLSTGIVKRVFQGPMETGLWYVHFAQITDFIGIRGIEKLALFFGYQPINMPNTIGLMYTQTRISSISANASYVFSYYSYFGLFAFFPSLLALWLLDTVVFFYNRIRASLIIPCITAITISSISFVSTEYTTVLISHGFLIILVVVFALNKIWSFKQ